MNKDEINRAIYDIETQYVNFHGFRVVTEKMHNCISLFREHGFTNNLCIIGESGTGKSSIAELFKVNYPDTELPEISIRTIVTVEVPSIGTISALIYQILVELGDPYPEKGLIPERTNRIKILIKECKTELLILDEAQHIYDRGQRKTHYATSDWLKGLIDSTRIPVILFGIPRLANLLNVNEQLRRRFEPPINLTRDSLEENESETHEIVKLLAPSMSIPLSSNDFKNNEISKRIFYATDGRVAYIKKLLIAAIESAIVFDQEIIDIPTLEYSFTQKIWPLGIERLNPFNKNFIFRRLDKSGEPFHQERLV